MEQGSVHRTTLFSIVPDCFKTQKMCDKAAPGERFHLQRVPDWFVTQQQIGPWCDDNKLIKWYDGYKKCNTQRAKIKEELMPIAWHPSRWWCWCVPEDEKKETEKL